MVFFIAQEWSDTILRRISSRLFLPICASFSTFTLGDHGTSWNHSLSIRSSFANSHGAPIRAATLPRPLLSLPVGARSHLDLLKLSLGTQFYCCHAAEAALLLTLCRHWNLPATQARAIPSRCCYLHPQCSFLIYFSLSSCWLPISAIRLNLLNSDNRFL